MGHTMKHTAQYALIGDSPNFWDTAIHELPDWEGMLLELAGRTNIYPGDIDGHLERRGNHIHLEWKRPGVTPWGGQWQAFKDLALHRGHTCLVVWGEYPRGPVTHMRHVGYGRPKVEATLGDFQEFMYAWWAWATDNPFIYVPDDNPFGGKGRT